MITFDLYGPNLSIVYTNTIAVNGDETYITTFVPSTPVPGLPITGTYGWVVNSSGDANNNPGVSSIGNESGQLQPANPGLSTDTSPPQVTLSSGSPPILTDPATLSSAFEETGTTTFDLYAPGGTVPIHTEIVSVSGNGTYTTAIGYTLPTTGTVTGTYQWVASYSGDANNNSVASARGTEPVSVTAACQSVSTTPNPASVALNFGGSSTLNDSATLAGGYNETGSLTLTLYAPHGTTVDTETVTVSGNGTYTTPAGDTLPTTGCVTGTYE